MVTVLKVREHQFDEDCWCKPVVKQYPNNGEVIIHGDELGVHLGLHAVLVAEGRRPDQAPT
jgi:hypothetical protein